MAWAVAVATTSPATHSGRGWVKGVGVCVCVWGCVLCVYVWWVRWQCGSSRLRVLRGVVVFWVFLGVGVSGSRLRGWLWVMIGVFGWAWFWNLLCWYGRKFVYYDAGCIAIKILFLKSRLSKVFIDEMSQWYLTAYWSCYKLITFGDY